MHYTTGDIARRTGCPRSVVCYALERAGIQPAARAGITRLFTPEQWPDIITAIRNVRGNRSHDKAV